MNIKNSAGPDSGFTLVELAIVMIIIGLLIGGILKGQELILNTKIKRTIQDINSYRSAVLTFQDIYDALPGDLKNPGNLLPGCSATTACVAAGGNQDGFIGTKGVANWSRDDQSLQTSEPTQFWLHLKLADLIGGVTGGTNLTWGSAYPASPIGGGFQVFNANETGSNQASGHYYMLRLNPTGDPHPTTPGVTVLSPRILERIDKQFDDGLPNTGSIIADDAAGLCWNTATFKYVSNSDSKICLAAFRFY